MTTTASTDVNIDTVIAIYAAFGRGDVPAILDRLADDVTWDGDWADNSAQHSPVEHFLPRHGIAQVAEFFAVISAYQFHHFEVVDVMASDRQVVAQIKIDASLPNGGRFRDEELHLWAFGTDGKVTGLRHYIDTAKHLDAARGVDTTR